MKKISLIIISAMFLLLLVGCNGNSEGANKGNIIAVSIPPQKGIVQAISGDKYEVITMIPPGYSPTNYEPSPKSMQQLSEARLYLTIGVPAEENIIESVRDFNKNIEIIDLSEKAFEMYGVRTFSEEDNEEHEDHEEHAGHNHAGVDPHQWMSPKRVKLMSQEIKELLISIDSENKDTYEENYIKFSEKLDNLHNQITELVENDKSFLIYHPSLGYLADDYGLNMITIEDEGKEATPKRMQEIIDICRKNNITTVFYQAEIDSRQAEIIAREISGEVYKINPLEENYEENIQKVIEALKYGIR
ncbi:metal ABC transporter solute-binding protein, Zn/Mn family [Oceanirhabdus seepicola]|uniref:Zinc ABC transporter substrate-binding protein n=1 Tax=Oceanirhabdus seepicola TaxID=2828781 RepID=A0A9J6P541_9CLOT|nr:zinc ABC transporter substrate-binding protein [Oceanirhabdus seepicola]MCM1991906.1 zinc ABC transporter substrate-binding protein [Oceanirhabdus seepicola]